VALLSVKAMIAKVKGFKLPISDIVGIEAHPLGLRCVGIYSGPPFDLYGRKIKEGDRVTFIKEDLEQ